MFRSVINWFQSGPHNQRRRPQPWRLRIESLEDRIQPSALIQFDTNYLDMGKMPATATMTNVGPDPYVVTEIDLPGLQSDFRVTEVESTGSGFTTGIISPSLAGMPLPLADSGATLAAGQSITFHVIFSPKTAGFEYDSLVVQGSTGETDTVWMDDLHATATPIDGQPGAFTLNVDLPLLSGPGSPIRSVDTGFSQGMITGRPPPSNPLIIESWILITQPASSTLPRDFEDPTLTPDVPGVYTAQFVLGEFDGHSLIYSTSPVVTVISGLQTVKVTPADNSVNVGDTVTYSAEGFDGQGHSLGDITPYTRFDATPADAISPANGVAFASNQVLTAVSAGTYQVIATVSIDSLPDDTVQGSTTVTVNDTSVNEVKKLKTLVGEELPPRQAKSFDGQLGFTVQLHDSGDDLLANKGLIHLEKKVGKLLRKNLITDKVATQLEQILASLQLAFVHENAPSFELLFVPIVNAGAVNLTFVDPSVIALEQAVLAQAQAVAAGNQALAIGNQALAAVDFRLALRTGNDVNREIKKLAPIIGLEEAVLLQLEESIQQTLSSN